MRERLRNWIESLETFALDVIFERRHGKRAALLRAVLYVLSKVFLVLIKLRLFLYRIRLLRDTTLGVQVVAVGNLTVGGTGKTPVVERLARELTRQGRKVAILSRGYRSKPPPLLRRLVNRLLHIDPDPPRVVSDGQSLLLDSETAGDEPYMLASNLRDVVVLVDKDRVKSGRYAVEKFGCDILLLDDGFQYWKLAGRRQDVVLIDCEQPFGNNYLLPRGTLREPPSHLSRAHIIMITKSNGKTAELRELLRRFNPRARIIETVHRPLYLEEVYTGERKPLEMLRGRKVACVSGIAQPESFEKTLIELGCELVYSKRFADHHRYTQQEILNVINRGKIRAAEMVLTTQKDAVRFPKLDWRDLPIYFLRVEIEIVRGAKDFEECVRRICFSLMILDRILYWSCFWLVWVVQHLPLRWVALIGRFFGLLAYYVDRRHRKIAIENLRQVFGDEYNGRSILSVAREHFQRLGENYACALRTLVMSEEEIDRILEVRGAEKVQLDNPALGKCRIMAIGHFGNFELYAKAAHYAPGYRFATTYRALRPESLNRLFQSIRSRSGCLYFERRTEASELHRALARGKIILGLLADQHAGKHGVITRFFGRPASTTPALALYALRYKTPVFPAFCYRVGLARWRIEVGDPIPVIVNGRPRSVVEITRDINAAFEEAIRKDPANWFWVHRRWKILYNTNERNHRTGALAKG